MSLDYNSITILKDLGLYKVARDKKVYPPERDFLNCYYIITNGQQVVAGDIAFLIEKEEYQNLIKSNYDERLISKYIGDGRHFESVTNEPEEMPNDNQ